MHGPSVDFSPPAAVRLVALDLDGTLLQSGDAILDADRDAVAQARRQGVHVVLASARPPRSARHIYDALGLDTPYVAYNGALIQSMGGSEVLHHRPLPADLAGELIAFARELEPAVVLELERLDAGMTDRLHDNLRTQTSLRFAMNQIAPVDELLAGGPITKLMLMAATPRVRRLETAISEAFAGRVHIAVSDRHLIQLLHPSVNKADGVRRVSGTLGIGSGEVLAIGDAPNDAELLAWAGTGVAAGNGWDAAKRAADAVGPHHGQGVVAWAIERFVL
ncbi:MAG: Cof-type HAD-IIB family hydrolase [Planctomycetota bacterium]